MNYNKSNFPLRSRNFFFSNYDGKGFDENTLVANSRKAKIMRRFITKLAILANESRDPFVLAMRMRIS